MLIIKYTLFLPLLLKQNPHRWRIGIIILPTPQRPNKNHQENYGNGKAYCDEQNNDGHGCDSFLAATNRTANEAKPTTLMLLMGMRMAATSGDRLPDTANERAMAL